MSGRLYSLAVSALLGFLLFCLQGSIFAVDAPPIPQTERDALIALYKNTNGDKWSCKQNWLGPWGTEGSWCGVKVENGHVVELRLSKNGLDGQIPSEVGNLTHLRLLTLNADPFPTWGGGIPNKLTGDIPAEIGKLVNLESLDLAGLGFSSIPPELGNLAKLAYADLAGNKFDRIPPEFGRLGNLKKLFLGGNRLTSFPVEFGNLASLEILDLSSNPFVGLPSQFAGLTQLKSLYMRGSSLERIPAVLALLPNLENLNLSSRHSQTILNGIGALSRLRVLVVYAGQLSKLPAEIGNLSSLRILGLARNNLSAVPPEFAKLIGLEELDLSENQFTRIPIEIGSLTNLRKLRIGGPISGTIPPFIGNLTKLAAFGLSGEQITGTIPPEIGNMLGLTTLSFTGTRLAGQIPATLGNLKNLVSLNLTRNQLSGEIPPELGNLQQLRELRLYDNQLSGPIPPQLGNLPNLWWVEMQNNNLSGRIPPELGKALNLYLIRLHGNRLTGEVPLELAKLQGVFIQQSDFRWNGLSASHPETRKFLNDKQIGRDWESTQTVAPKDLRIASVTKDSVDLKWTPISYTADPGGYRVLYSTNPGGPYGLYSVSENKKTSSVSINGLEPGTTYYFVVQTITEPHTKNKNRVVSEPSAEVSASTIPVSLYLPIVQRDSSDFAGFSVSNFSDKSSDLSLAAFGADGKPIAALSSSNQFRLEARKHLAKLSSELFVSDQGKPGWIQLSSSNPEIAALFQFGSNGRLDGVSAFDRLARKLYFTRVLEGPGTFLGKDASTFLLVANPNNEPVSLRMKLLLRGEATPSSRSDIQKLADLSRVLPPKGMLRGTVAELFGIQSITNGFVEVEVIDGNGVMGFEFIRFPDAEIGLKASFGNAFAESYSAQFSTGRFSGGERLFTSLKLINTSDEKRSITARITGEDGKPLADPVIVELASGEMLETDASQLFNFGSDDSQLRTGSLHVQASGDGVIGDVIFGNSSLRFAAALPLQTQKFTKAVFSHVTNTAQFFTGLALLYPGSSFAEVMIEIFSTDGIRTGEKIIRLEAGQRISRLTGELVPAALDQAGGYIVLRSSQPIIAQQLFGNTSLDFLSAVPPRIVEIVSVYSPTANF